MKEDLVNILVNELNLEIIYVSTNNTEENNTEENNITNNEENITINQNQNKLNNSNINRENDKHFHCSTCNYSTINKYDYNKHLFTQKHIKLNTTKEEITNTNKFICSCGKKYLHKQSLWRHKTKCHYNTNLANSIPCNTNTIDLNNDKKMEKDELIIQILKMNNELLEIMKIGTNNCNNTTREFS